MQDQTDAIYVTANLPTQKKQSAQCVAQKGKFMKKYKHPPRFPNVARTIKDARLKMGMSQEFLSSQLDYKKGQFVSNIERGLCALPDDKIRSLCDVLDLSPEIVVEAIVQDYREQMNAKIK